MAKKRSRAYINARRDYKREAAYEDRPEQVARRVKRNQARDKMENKYGKKALRGKEVDHKNMNPSGKLSNRPNNLRLLPIKANRRKQPKRKGY